MPIEILKIFGGAILLIGFFYFLAIRAISTKNYKRKSLYLFIFGLVIFLFFIGGIIYDIIKGLDLSEVYLGYYAFPIIAFVYMVSSSLYYYIKGRNLKQKFKSNSVKQNSKPTIKDKKEFLYIILKHEGNFLLVKEVEKEDTIYKGITIKFPHNEFFHDELVKEYIVNNNLDVISYSQVGKATKHDKKDNIYYCYKLLLNSIPLKITDLVEIDSYKLVSLNMNEADKKIIYTSVVENNFDITL